MRVIRGRAAVQAGRPRRGRVASRSSARICWESDGAAMCNRRAAEANRCSSATVRKDRSWRRSTRHGTAGQDPGGRRVRAGLIALWIHVTTDAMDRRVPRYEQWDSCPLAGRAAGSVGADIGNLLRSFLEGDMRSDPAGELLLAETATSAGTTFERAQAVLEVLRLDVGHLAVLSGSRQPPSPA